MDNANSGQVTGSQTVATLLYGQGRPYCRDFSYDTLETALKEGGLGLAGRNFTGVKKNRDVGCGSGALWCIL